MKLLWESQTGQQRETNNDSAGLFHSDHDLIAIVLDAAQRTDHSQEFAQLWVQSFINNMGKSKVDLQDIVQALQQTHEALRRTFLAEIASYACFHYCKSTEKITCFVVGDCRIGVQTSANSNIKWLTPVHTLSNKEGQDFTEEMLIQPEKHVLTRTLNARRFSMPDIIEIPASEIMVIATDGYWKNHVLTQESTKDDDISRLEIDLSVANFELSIQSDVDNIYVRNLV